MTVTHFVMELAKKRQKIAYWTNPGGILFATGKEIVRAYLRR
jgi:hypothetical protein